MTRERDGIFAIIVMRMILDFFTTRLSRALETTTLRRASRPTIVVRSFSPEETVLSKST